MKNVYFVQVGFGFDGSVYLPYAVGTMLAYCKGDSEINKAYAFPDIIFKREKLNAALEKIKEPYFVGFSCSVWNMEYNKALARLIKKNHPSCIIAFGGHSVNENAELLAEEPYIDLLMLGEGELTLHSLLKNLNCGELEKTPNIAYRKNGETVCTPREYNFDISNYPSPYLNGIFDDIIDKNPTTEFLAVLETNRGCPYSCAYCDWTAGRKMRFFPMEKVKAEIKWLSDHKIAYCFCADSNFGMFDRDVEIAEALIEAKKKTGYPEVFRPCYEKNSADRVFKICSTLNSVGMDKGATMAYQTLCDKALENIGRKNLTMEHFSSLMKRYNQAGIPTYSELILGLPGETAESFCKGICKLFENGQHNSVSVYYCEILPNSEMAQPEYVEKHGIEVMKVGFNHIHSAPQKDEEVKEFSYLVRSTNTMSREDWVYANLFSICVQAFHSLGALRCFAMYLHEEKGVSYYDFYSSLLRFIMNGKGELNKLWNGFKVKYESSFDGDWNYYNKTFGNVTWFFEEGAFLEIVNGYEAYFTELREFLNSFNIDGDLFEELAHYQKAILRKPFDKEQRFDFKYNFYRYFESITMGDKAKLEKASSSILITPKTEYDNVAEYAKETVWFGRRRGATIFGAKEVTVL